MKILKPKLKRQEMDVTGLKKTELRIKTTTDINKAVEYLSKDLGPSVVVEERDLDYNKKIVDIGKRILQKIKPRRAVSNDWQSNLMPSIQ